MSKPNATKTETSSHNEVYEQVYDGDWNTYRWRGNREMCCDCGLVHWTDYRIGKDGGLEGRARRDQSRTYAARRRQGIKIIKNENH